MAFVPGGGRNQPHKLGGFWPTGQGFGTKGGGGGGSGAAGGGAGAAGGGAGAVAGAAGGAGAGAGGGPVLPGQICCWLCGFPIADRFTQKFPGTNKQTTDPLWGTGVGEHIVDSELGYGYVGIYQRRYGCLLNGNEKEFLKREIRWAHRYCNKIKNLYLITSKTGELQIKPLAIEYLVLDLFNGGKRTEGDKRKFLGANFEIKGDINSWRNLISYFIDCSQKGAGDDFFKAKYETWVDNRIRKISETLSDYCDVVNTHIKKMPEYSYAFRMRNKSAIHDNIRAYQQQEITRCPLNKCEYITNYYPSPTFDDNRMAPIPLSVENALMAQDEEERRVAKVLSDGEDDAGGGGGGAFSSPPRRENLSNAAKEARRRKVEGSGRALIGLGGGNKARGRNTVTDDAKENEQVLALWGYYNGPVTADILSSFDIPITVCDIHQWPHPTRNGPPELKRLRKLPLGTKRRSKNRRRSTRKRAQ